MRLVRHLHVKAFEKTRDDGGFLLPLPASPIKPTLKKWGMKRVVIQTRATSFFWQHLSWAAWAAGGPDSPA